MRLDVSTPVSFDRLRNEFHELAVVEGWSDAKRANRWSYLRRAVEATIAHGAATGDDLRPALSILHSFAPPPDGGSSVRKTLSLLLGAPVTHKLRGYRLDEQRWAPLIAVCRRRGGGRTHFSQLEAVLRAGGAWEAAPTAMPDVPALKAAADSIAMARSTLRAAIANYRGLREMLRAQDPTTAKDFAPIVARHARCIGIESLPADTLTPMLRACGVDEHPADLTLDDLLRHLAPRLHEEWTAWKEDPRRGERRGLVTLQGEYQTARALSRTAAGLILAGRAELLASLSLLSLWNPTALPLCASTPLDAITQRARQFIGRADQPVLHPPMRVAMDATADLSRVLAGVKEGTYTVSSVTILQRMWTLTGGVYRRAIQAADPASWKALKEQFTAALNHAIDCEATPVAIRDKGKLLDLVSLPHFVCLGLPLLELERQRIRAEWLWLAHRAHTAGHAVADVPGVRQAHAAYADAAELRLLPGIYIADGLRLGNYRNGVLGVNYIFTLKRDASGRAIGFDSISTRWSGADRERARTKRTLEPKQSGRTRRLRVSQRNMPAWHEGHVPYAALWQYLEEVTLPRAIAAGVISVGATVEDMIEAKCVPLLLSRRCRPGHLIRQSATSIGVECVGRALWWTAKHVLGRDVPEWDELDRGAEHFRIFVGHDTRLLLSCFWGKVRADWEYAAFITNDKKDTLVDFYSADAYARWAEAAGDVSHWDHPHAFDVVMDRVRHDRSFRPQPSTLGVQLPPALHALMAAWKKRDQAQAKRGAVPLLCTTRIRRARPGQLPPKKSGRVAS